MDLTADFAACVSPGLRIEAPGSGHKGLTCGLEVSAAAFVDPNLVVAPAPGLILDAWRPAALVGHDNISGVGAIGEVADATPAVVGGACEAGSVIVLPSVTESPAISISIPVAIPIAYGEVGT